MGEFPNAWTDDAVDLTPYLLNSGASRGTQDIFGERIEGWLDQVQTAFAHIPGARRAFKGAEDLAGDIVALAGEVPDMPDLA